ncbi:MAG: serine/threonine-protein phosphatase [Candidatus Aminicenantes bacterium]|nr:MAG: serine/threonine-protein phosphatase [Candidatus Aminicenantes bacterium]
MIKQMEKKRKKQPGPANIYREESRFLEELEIDENYKKLKKNELLDKFFSLVKEYKKLLKHATKITRIGDSTQRRLLLANEKIEKQNKELADSRKALLEELSHAAEYVKSLIPAPLTRGPILTEWCFVPSVQLGGDSLGYHWLDKEHFAMYLLDVCSHGVRPALLSVSVINVLRSQNLLDTDFKKPGEVLTGLNQVFQMKKHHNLFFSIWYGVYNSMNRQLTFASAGHPPALLLNGTNNKAIELRTPNLFIGGMSETSYRSESIFMEKPAVLYIFSDGAFEVDGSKEDTIWDLKELKKFLERWSKENNRELEQLHAFLRKIHGSSVLEDDFSILKVIFK